MVSLVYFSGMALRIDWVVMLTYVAAQYFIITELTHYLPEKKP